LSYEQRVTQRLLAVRSRVRTFIGSASFIALATAPLDKVHADSAGLSPAEDWAWSQIREGVPADLDTYCDHSLDPQNCRTLRSTFLESILKQSPFRDAVPDSGVDVRNAKIVGDVNLSFATLKHPLKITNSRFEGGISLEDARAERFIDLSGSSVSGVVNANALQVGGAMHMHSSGPTQSGFHDVSLIGAKVVGDLDMVAIRVEGDLNAHGLQVGGSLILRSETKNGQQASVSGEVTLEGAHIERDLNLNDAQVQKNLNANALQVGGAMHMRSDPEQGQASFHDVSLIGAKVVGDLDMVGIRINGTLNAHGLQVGGSLVLRSDVKVRAAYGLAPSAPAIDLTSARVAGNVEMDGVYVNGSFDAAGLQVGESLLMRPSEGKSDGKYMAAFYTISLGGAKIDGSLDMTGALVDSLDAPSLQVNGSVRICPPSNCHFRRVVLQSARVAGGLDMEGANVAEPILLGSARIDGNLNMNGARLTKLDAPSLHVGESLSMKFVEQRAGSLAEIALGSAKIDGELDLSDARIETLNAPSLRVGGNLKLDGAQITTVILEGASVGGQIRVGGTTRGTRAPAKVDKLFLQNARAGSLVDGGEISWPKQQGTLKLDGFTFSRFGADDMAKRPHNSWDNWARTDKEAGAYPYEQLAAAYAAAGDHNAVDDFRFDQRVRASESAEWWEMPLTYVLRYGAGYGIGYYMFRALYWALGLAALGAVVLWFWVKGAAEGKHGLVWCFGASVNRLLPFITLKKEFSDFFNDPQVNKFTRGQDVFFVLFGAIGWLLGAVVLAAMGTFTRGG
jgi:cytoskeletal protein CcmA (bactofilin family)